MIIVKIADDLGANRFLSLENGQHVFGASLEADYVLIDPEMRELHFALDISDEGVCISFLNDVSDDGTDGDESASLERDWQVLPMGEMITIGGLQISVSGEILTKQESQLQKAEPTYLGGVYVERVKSATRAVTRPLPITAMLAVLLGVPIVWASITMPVETNVETVSDFEEEEHSPTTLKADAQATGQILGREEKKQAATKQPLPLPRPPAAKLLATAADNTQKSISSPTTPASLAISQLDYSDIPVTQEAAHAEVIVDEARRILRSFKVRIDEVTVDGSKLQVMGDVPAAEAQEKISDTLVEDISPIESVTFSYRPEDDWRSVKSDILAIWTGKQPYIVLKTEGPVRLGDKFRRHYILEAVHNDRITVSIAGDKQEIEF